MTGMLSRVVALAAATSASLALAQSARAGARRSPSAPTAVSCSR